jgi:hypothetical protein
MHAGKALASFGDWSDLCRQPLLWLGCSDPTASIFEAMARDPDREMLGRLLAQWEVAFGHSPTMVREALRLAPVRNPELIDIIRDIAEERGEINRRKLGWWIKRHEGRIVDGRRFARGDGNSSAEAWRVESVLSVSPVSTTPGDECASRSQTTNTSEAGPHETSPEANGSGLAK